MAYRAQFEKSLTVSLRPEVYNKIEELSDAEGISKGNLVREALDVGLPIVIEESCGRIRRGGTI